MPYGNHEEAVKALEIQKLEYEIFELRKPIYRKASFYAVVGPSLLAVITLFIGLYTGLFEV